MVKLVMFTHRQLGRGDGQVEEGGLHQGHHEVGRHLDILEKNLFINFFPHSHPLTGRTWYGGLPTS